MKNMLVVFLFLLPSLTQTTKAHFDIIFLLHSNQKFLENAQSNPLQRKTSAIDNIKRACRIGQFIHGSTLVIKPQHRTIRLASFAAICALETTHRSFLQEHWYD